MRHLILSLILAGCAQNSSSPANIVPACQGSQLVGKFVYGPNSIEYKSDCSFEVIYSGSRALGSYFDTNKGGFSGAVKYTYFGSTETCLYERVNETTLNLTNCN